VPDASNFHLGLHQKKSRLQNPLIATTLSQGAPTHSKSLHQSKMDSASPNGTPFFLSKEKAQGLANYPHARIVPGVQKTVYVSGTSSRRGDGTYAGCTTDANGNHKLDIREQTKAVLENIGTIINGATNGMAGLESVIDATVFLTDMSDYAGMNEEWNKVWGDKTTAPARTCVQVAALPSPKLNVEIKCMALYSEAAR
jgi:2-aminomuconate deaminase